MIKIYCKSVKIILIHKRNERIPSRQTQQRTNASYLCGITGLVRNLYFSHQISPLSHCLCLVSCFESNTVSLTTQKPKKQYFFSNEQYSQSQSNHQNSPERERERERVEIFDNKNNNGIQKYKDR